MKMKRSYSVLLCFLALLALAIASKSFEDVDANYIDSADTSWLLGMYDLNLPLFDDKTTDIINASTKFAKTIAGQCSDKRIADFNRDTLTLTPRNNSICTDGCKIQYSTKLPSPWLLPNETEQWTDLTKPIEFSYADLYLDPEMRTRAGHWHVTVRCACLNAETSTWEKIKLPRSTAVPGVLESDTFQGVHLPLENPSDPETPTSLGGLRHVVYMLADAVSRPSISRYYPGYLSALGGEHKPFKTVRMGNYNVVSFNTVGNTIPLFGGLPAPYVKNKVLGLNSKFPKDEAQTERFSSMIWDFYRGRGFKTALINDHCTMVSAHNHGYRMGEWGKHFDYVYFGQACSIAPPMYVFSNPRRCIGDKPLNQDMLQFSQDLMDTHGESDRLAIFLWSGEGHCPEPACAVMPMEMCVDAVKQFMMDRNDTMLITYSDHGTGYGKFFGTTLGNFEHKLPFFDVHVPNWWAEKYPDTMKVLENNRHNVFSVWDFHFTMKHLTDFPDSVAEHRDEYFNKTEIPANSDPRSLFEPLASTPFERTCEDAGIPLEYCVLTDKSPWMSKEDLEQPEVRKVYAGIVRHLNRLTAKQPGCQRIIPVNSQAANMGFQWTVVEPNWNPPVRQRYRLQFQTNMDSEFTGVAEMAVNKDGTPFVKVISVGQVSSFRRFDGCRPKALAKDFPPDICLCEIEKPKEQEEENPKPKTTTPESTKTITEEPEARSFPITVLLAVFALVVVAAIIFSYLNSQKRKHGSILPSVQKSV